MRLRLLALASLVLVSGIAGCAGSERTLEIVMTDKYPLNVVGWGVADEPECGINGSVRNMDEPIGPTMMMRDFPAIQYTVKNAEGVLVASGEMPEDGTIIGDSDGCRIVAKVKVERSDFYEVKVVAGPDHAENSVTVQDSDRQSISAETAF